MMFSQQGGPSQVSAAMAGLLEAKRLLKRYFICVSGDGSVNLFLIFLAVCDYLCGCGRKEPVLI